MAMYLLAAAIIDATRAMDQHTEATERNRQAADRAAAAQQAVLKRMERRDRIWRPIAVALASLGLLVVLLNLGLWLATHVHVSL